MRILESQHTPFEAARASTAAEQENVLRLLHDAAQHQQFNRKLAQTPLERAILRAGELRLTEAVPALLNLLGSGNAWRDYCVAWALGWCGDESAVLALARLTEDARQPQFVRRIAREALLKLFDDEIKQLYRTATINQLPSGLRELAARGTADGFARVLGAYLAEPGAHCAVLDTLYQVDNERVRPGFLLALRTAPLSTEWLETLRELYPAALYRRDAEVLGIIAARCDDASTTPLFKTGAALRRRIWRTLQRLSVNGEAAFANRSIGVWLAQRSQRPALATRVRRQEYSHAA